MAYEGDDPLDLWNRYVIWVEETFPQGGKEGDMLTILEKCLEHLRDNARYKNDQRFLDIYLRYMELSENNVEWYQMLFAGGYFHRLAGLYVSWAQLLEQANNFKEANKVFKLAFENKAEPHQKLDESFQKYQVGETSKTSFQRFFFLN